MAILDTVKQALGIFYSETNKDAEISNIIAGAKAFLIGAGWPSSDLAANAETDLAVQAIVIYAKMAVNTDPAEMKMNPMLVAMIAQARVQPEVEPEPEPEPEPTPDPEPDPEPDPDPTPDPEPEPDPVDPDAEGDGE